MLRASLIGDEQRLSQVLLNLLTNAVKYMDQGSVTLRILDLGFEILDCESSKSQIFQPVSGQVQILKFEISDEQIAHIFEPFSRVEDVARTGVPINKLFH